MHTPNNHGAPSGGPATPPTPTPNLLLATKPREDALEQAAGALPDARDEPDAPRRSASTATPTLRGATGAAYGSSSARSAPPSANTPATRPAR
jgi:hypothetical protein